jgi:phenylalanyl-tRNA synthetase alpha chain
LVNTCFWNFDALFVPQDHPAREMQDTFYMKSPSRGKLPDKAIVERVRAMHEHGGKIGSLGWQYKWGDEPAKKLVLRTHTTVLSSRTLAALKKSDWPAKFFAVGRCFRNEALDWCHLFEFNQTEGIVIDENANFKHLLGYLKRFFAKLGFPQARFRPAYFPYTEPSIEIDVFHPVHKEWVELGGAGMFRPEVVEPLLGEAVPVLAWGPGFDRIMMEYYKITDLRDLYKNDLSQLRGMRQWMR